MSLASRQQSGAAWTDADLKVLRQLVRLELPMRTIARKLQRSEQAVRQTSHRLALDDMKLGWRRSLDAA